MGAFCGPAARPRGFEHGETQNSGRLFCGEAGPQKNFFPARFSAVILRAVVLSLGKKRRMEKHMGYFARITKAAAGLALYGLGAYLTIQAGIGLAPWDVFNMGVSGRTPLSFGGVSIVTGFIILFVDLLIGERIGLGMIMDSLIVGASVDVFRASGLIPAQSDFLVGVVMVMAGFGVMGLACWLYMSAGLGCGPRDCLMVGLGKRLRRAPIGLVKVGMDAVVLSVGWLLGGPVGFGTVISVLGAGIIMQGVFRVFRFEPRDVQHEDLLTTIRNMAAGLRKAHAK